MRRLILVAAMVSFAALAIERKDELPGLAQVKRIYIDQLGGGRESDQMRDMLFAALQNSGLFTITENPDRADAILKGSSDDKIYTEEHHTSDSLGVHANSGAGSSSTARLGNGSSSREYGGAGITENESSSIQERRHEAVATVRLVDGDGDVIWSMTQESTGGKFRGAMADIADRISKKLAEDTRKARAAH